MQQGNAALATAAMYDHQSSAAGTAASASGEDAVMARWLQSAGLQHLASPVAPPPDQRVLPNLLMQGYGPQTAEEKQKLLKLLRNLNFGDSSADMMVGANSFGGGGAMEGFYATDMRGEFGAGLLDLHAMDDTELLPDHVMSEPFEPSPFMPGRGFENDFDIMQGEQAQEQADGGINPLAGDKDIVPKESNVAKIKVVVRKRPLNKKEISRKEEDIVTVHDNTYMTVHEPKLKVDLTAYVEKHEFCFDAVLDEYVTNDEVYRVTVEPIIPTIFQRGKATCFAYGQTGSGKTFTMQPLPLRASEDIVRLLRQPLYRNQKFKLWLSYFEIYGGKLFDLLNDRRKLLMREDGRQQVCIVGLQEFEVSDVQIVKEFIEKGNAARSTGSTGANEESSRSHAILQLAIKKQIEIKDTRRQNDVNEPRSSRLVGKISFIDLAGSERGADTTDNDRLTRIEGAEINKSLLALKECIRALDNDQIHIPFRGSKLTEVLRDSFVGNSRTVMISCISPSAGSCEHTLNTLRYADRVKSLSKSGNSKKDQPPASLPSSKESSSASSFPFTAEPDLPAEAKQEMKATEVSRRNVEVVTSYSAASELDRHSTNLMGVYSSNGRDDGRIVSDAFDRERSSIRNGFNVTTSYKSYSSSQSSSNNLDEEKVSKVSPTRRRISRDDKLEKQNAWSKEDSATIMPATTQKQQINDSSHNVPARQYEQEALCRDMDIDAILEEEEALVAAHRKEIENTMDIVREEMKLLEEVDQPGSLIDNYVTQLNFVLSRKVAGLVSLQARLARFQQRLKEQEILSRKRGPR